MNTDQNKKLTLGAPLRHHFFRALWIANAVSLIGTWMHEVGAAWLMTTLRPSPFMVAMVQTAVTLPFFLLALPAGALADIINHRRLMLLTQIWMMIMAACLGLLTTSGMATPLILLIFTFALSLGAAVNAPTWQAVIPELIPREELPAAITLGSVGFNIARAVGPALGGLAVARLGPGAVFLLNAASFFGVILVLRRWNPVSCEHILPAERLIGAMKTGIRYVRNAPKVQSVLIHTGIFSFFGCTLWAFMPIVVRQFLGLSSMGYGILFGLFGVGALMGAAILPKVWHRYSMNVLVCVSVILFAVSILALGYIKNTVFLAFSMMLGGVAWLILFSIYTTAIQAVIPSWVRGRVISVFMLVFFGGMAGGSALWGALAGLIGIPATLTFTTACLIVSIPFTKRFELTKGEELDLTPSQGWPAEDTLKDMEPEKGPVLVVVEYHIEPDDVREFVEAMRSVRTVRLQAGAIRWNLFRSISDPGSYTESFIVESWIEYLRQSQRMTVEDEKTIEKPRTFHKGDSGPETFYFVAESTKKQGVEIT